MIAIVGAGLAGLAAAWRLRQAGHGDFLVLERATRVGGRVETLTVEGYRLDRGFHVANTAYRAFRSLLPVARLEPAWFDSGALVQRGDGALVPFLNPWRHPRRAFSGGAWPLAAPDLARLAWLGAGSLLAREEGLMADHRRTAAQCLERLRFSQEAVDGFFRPFFGGVFLDNELGASAGLFRYCLRQFLRGRAFLPGGGIQRLAGLLSADLPDSHLRLGAELIRIERGADGFRLALADGEILSAAQVIVAADPVTTAKLMDWPEPPMRSTATVYFRSRRPLYEERLLVLPRARRPLVRHFTQVTNLDPSLAPVGRHLLSATVLEDRGLGDAGLFELAAEEIQGVIPGASALLEPLQVVRVPQALPLQGPAQLSSWRERRHHLGPGLHLAGDLAGNASQQNALETGLDAADAALSGRKG
jgi:phytoene dehydrogenase-like protein